MEPVAEENDVSSQIVVVKVAVRVFARRLTYYDTSVEAVYFLQSCVSVPEMRAFVSSHPLVPVYRHAMNVSNKVFIAEIVLQLPERATLLNRALRHERYTVVILGAPLPNSVPMDGHFHTLDVVLHVDHDLVALADLDTGSGYHSVRCQNPSFHAVC